MKYLGYLVIALLLSFCLSKKQVKNELTISREDAAQVGPNEFNSSLSYYGTSPESPDGKLIAFTVFLEETKEVRSEKVPAEIWVCNRDLTNYRKVTSTTPLQTHNGARVQWLDNQSLLYEDDSIRVVNLEGKHLIKAVAGRSGHDTYDGKFLYAGNDAESGLSAIFECDIATQKQTKLADVKDFVGLLDHFSDPEFIEVNAWRVLHLQYNPDGSKLAFRIDIGPKNEHYRHLVTMNYDGSDVKFFGPKPMHFLWFDRESITGHDNQVEDGMPNDKHGRRWSLDRKVLETVSGPGNHFGFSPARDYFASESWYGEDTVVVRVFRKNETTPIWSDIASTNPHTTWTLAYHTNPSFSRDGKRMYYNKCVGPRKVQVFMVEFTKQSEG